MTVVVTRDVTARFRGFLASCMLEIAPGVYTAPKMNRAVRERVWAVLEEWFAELGGGGIVMTWLEPLSAGGQQVAVLGSAPYELYEHDGVFLARKRPLGRGRRLAGGSLTDYLLTVSQDCLLVFDKFILAVTRREGAIRRMRFPRARGDRPMYNCDV